jgi:PAS domain S-box-containing protein
MDSHVVSPPHRVPPGAEPAFAADAAAELESAFAAAPVGLAVFDFEGRYLRVNDELAHINGLPAAEHVGRTVHDVVPVMADEVLRIIRQVQATGATIRELEFTGETQRDPGNVRHWLSGFYPVRGADGSVRAVGAWVAEITERRRAMQQLEAARLKLEMGIQAAGLVMAEIDYRTDRNHISAELARLLALGDSATTVPRQAIFDRIHPDDRERYLQAIARTTDPTGNGHLAIDVRALLPGGDVRWLHIRLQVTFSMRDGRLQPDRGICAARDVTAEMVAERKLRAAQRLTESVIEGAGSLVFAKDLQGRYILSNQAWRRQWGLTAEQAEGVTDLDIFGPDVAPELRRNDLQVARTGEPLVVEEKVLVHGRHTTWRSSKFPLYDEAGQVYAVCGVSTDITDVVEADRRKDAFIATLAHELRNPLAPIRNGLEILRRSAALPPAAARTRDIMERQLTHMVRLVDDLLDVSRISRDKVDIRLEPLTVQRIVEHALETSHPALEAGGHRLELRLPAEPLALEGDLTRLAQVVSNLLNNAAKYTPRGGHIAVSAAVEGDAVRIDVTDDGAGIGVEMLPHVFDLFSQVDRTIDRAQGGLGIGLWLVKKLVELHGGTVAARSPGPGLGSTFTVRLPGTARRP